MIADSKSKIQTGEKTNKDKIKKIKLWQLQLEALSTTTQTSTHTQTHNYEKELNVFKMHITSENDVICMNKHENLSKHINHHFLTPPIKLVPLSDKKHQH